MIQAFCERGFIAAVALSFIDTCRLHFVLRRVSVSARSSGRGLGLFGGRASLDGGFGLLGGGRRVALRWLGSSLVHLDDDALAFRLVAQNLDKLLSQSRIIAPGEVLGELAVQLALHAEQRTQ